MAWLDDRIWAHPKLAKVSPSARWAYVCAIAYSSGFGLYGLLDDGHLRTLGVTKKVRAELEKVALWHPRNSGGIEINDWAEHNGRRDDALEARRQADRERKRLERERKRQTVTGQSRDSHAPESRDGHVTPDHAGHVTSAVTPPAPARRARVGARPMTSDRVTKEPSSSTSTTDAQPDDELRLRLDTLGLKGRALDIANELLAADRTRLDACITAATARGDDASSYLAELVLNGSHPDTTTKAKTEKSTLAAGAVGTRSSSPPLPDRPTEDEPEPAPPPKDFLALAGRTSEPPAPPLPTPKETTP